MKIFKHQGGVVINNNFLKCSVSHIRKYKPNLIITSPPYNVNLKYNTIEDAMYYPEYLKWTAKWLRKCYFILPSCGRLCCNIPLVNNKAKKPFYSHLVSIAEKIGYTHQTTIIWNKSNVARRTAWGSYLKPSAPYVIAPIEVIVVFYKKVWKRGGEGIDITKEEFIKWTNGLWDFPGIKHKYHPAAFPPELPKRLIKLYSYQSDVIMDPFLGSGTTILMSNLLKRKSVGIELDKKYFRRIVYDVKTQPLPIF